MKYLKLWVYVAVAAIGILATTLGPGDKNLGDLSWDDWLTTLGALLVSGAFVTAVSNIKGTVAFVAKAVVAFLGAVVTTGHSALIDGVVTQGEWLAILSTALAAAVAVYQVKGPVHEEPAAVSA